MRPSEELLREMAAVIVREVAPDKIILFGSWARGDARPNSDLDLLVVAPGPFGPGRSRAKEMVRLWRALKGFRVPKDILVFSADEVETWKDSLNHVIGRALREGKELYARQ